MAVSGLGEYGQVERSSAEQCMERPSSRGGEGTKVKWLGTLRQRTGTPVELCPQKGSHRCCCGQSSGCRE